MTALVTGIAGGLSRRVAAQLLAAGHEVVGVDYRDPTRAGEKLGIPTYRASYNKTAIEDVFRKHRFEHVLHLGRVGNLSEGMDKRFELNVLGSQKLFQLCVDRGAKSLVVLSTFHIYGAHPRNHIPISEEDALRAGTEFPEIGDAIQLDNMAQTFAYKHPALRTVVLRPTNVVGPHIRNTLCQVLRLPRVPYMAGFDPMSQFVHEDDLAAAIVAAMNGPSAGVFNVAGPSALPWRAAIALAGARGVPIPSSLVKASMRLFTAFPEYLVNFLKFPCVITDAAFRKEFGWAPQRSLAETLGSIRR